MECGHQATDIKPIKKGAVIAPFLFQCNCYFNAIASNSN